MSWWLMALALFFMLRLLRRRGCEHRAFGTWPERRLHSRQATSSPPAPPALDRRHALQRTIDGVVQEYVAGRIGVEEYERRLDELYRSAEGRRLVQGV